MNPSYQNRLTFVTGCISLGALCVSLVVFWLINDRVNSIVPTMQNAIENSIRSGHACGAAGLTEDECIERWRIHRDGVSI